MCLKGSPRQITLFVNTSLPKHVTTEEGGTAIFQCHFHSPRRSCNEWHVIEYYQNGDSQGNPTLYQFSQFCDRHHQNYSIINGSYTMNVSVSKFSELERSYHYRFNIHNVSVGNNNSYWTCSLSSNGKLQWQGNASLNVFTREGGTQASSTAILETNTSSNTAAAITIPVILLLMTAVAIASIGLVLYYKSRRSLIKRTLEKEGN